MLISILNLFLIKPIDSGIIKGYIKDMENKYFIQNRETREYLSCLSGSIDVFTNNPKMIMKFKSKLSAHRFLMSMKNEQNFIILEEVV